MAYKEDAYVIAEYICLLCNNRFFSVDRGTEKVSEESYVKHPNANKRWTRSADQFLLKLHNEGKSVKYIANKMGRSQTSIVMRLNKLKK